MKRMRIRSNTINVVVDVKYFKKLIKLYSNLYSFIMYIYFTNTYIIILINIMEDLLSSKTSNEFKVKIKDNQLRKKKKYG
jgi:hypothetical protein